MFAYSGRSATAIAVSLKIEMCLPTAADQPVMPGEGISLHVSMEDRVTYLEQQVAQLVMMVDMMKAQVCSFSQCACVCVCVCACMCVCVHVCLCV